MEDGEELQQAEAHLKRAEAELETAKGEERAALTDIEQAVEEIQEVEHYAHEIHFSVDGEPFETTKHELTPNQIIKQYGEKDPATNYLIQIKGNEKISYQGKGDEEIKLHDCMSFQVVSTGPTPVSDAVGGTAFVTGLTELGYNPQTLAGKSEYVFFSYPVEVGRCKGQTVRLGFVVPPDFPNIPPGGPHVSPHIQPLHPQGDVPHPRGGVHPSADFQQSAGGDWQYWSRPCPDWGQRKKTVASYMAHIWRLWETQ